MRKIDRQQCVEEIRQRLLRWVDEEHSACEVAQRFGVMCHGFSQWDFEELKRRYHWIVASRPNVTRNELEKLANTWQLARQQVFGTKLACDTQTVEHDTCRGFDDFPDADLARYHAEICGEFVEITPAPFGSKRLEQSPPAAQ